MRTPSPGDDAKAKTAYQDFFSLWKNAPFLPYSEERMTHVMDAWKMSGDVQQHFNDLELRIRNYGVTLLVAVLCATAFALKEKLTFMDIRCKRPARIGPFDC